MDELISGTNKLNPYYKVFLENLVVFSWFLCNPYAHCVHRSPSFDPILNQCNPTDIFETCFSKMHFNITLPYTLKSLNILSLYNKNCVCIFCFPKYAACLSNFILLDLITLVHNEYMKTKITNSRSWEHEKHRLNLIRNWRQWKKRKNKNMQKSVERM